MDHTIFHWINDLTTHAAWLDGPMKFFAGTLIFGLGVLLVGCYVQSRNNDNHLAVAGVFWAGLAALVALAIGQLINHAVGRARPFVTLSNVHLLISHGADFGFPSDHCTAAGAIATGLLLVDRRWGAVAAVVAVLVAFARVYVGVHYPGDVLGGLALGAVVAVIGHYALVPTLRRTVDRLATTPVRPLLTSSRG
ncbi:MAG: phosphatase PAP2 family protein [Ilumatobacteraceae bacterium]